MFFITGVSYLRPTKEERKSYYSSPTMGKEIPRIKWSKFASVLPYLVYNVHWKTCKDPFGFNPNMLPSDWNYPPSGCDYKNNLETEGFDNFTSKRSMKNIKIEYFFILIKRQWRKLQNHFYFLPTARKYKHKEQTNHKHHGYYDMFFMFMYRVMKKVFQNANCKYISEKNENEEKAKVLFCMGFYYFSCLLSSFSSKEKNCRRNNSKSFWRVLFHLKRWYFLILVVKQGK